MSTLQFKQVNLSHLYMHNKLLFYAIISDTHYSSTKNACLFMYIHTHTLTYLKLSEHNLLEHSASHALAQKYLHSYTFLSFFNSTKAIF